jgi:hypothetical protein
MQNDSEYDLIGNYPYQDVDSKFAAEFLARMLEPRDLEAAGKQLERGICPYEMGLKANQIDVALAVREVLKLPTYPQDDKLRRMSRDVIANLVKNAADANGGKVDGVKIIRLFMQYRNQYR